MAPASPVAAEPPAAIVAASVLVHAHSGGPSMSSGSGTVFATSGGFSFILTNHHVVAGASRFDVFIGGAKHPAGLLARDTEADLACLYIAGAAPTIPLAERLPPAGSSVWQVGFPGGHGPVKRYGRLNGLRGKSLAPGGGWADVLELTLTVRPGDSGSGLFSADCQLVGVVWGGDARGGPSTSAVGLDDCWRFVEQKCKIIGLIRGRRPPATPPKSPDAPPLYPPREPAPLPPVPPTMPRPPPIDVDAIRTEIQALRDAIAAVRDRKPEAPADLVARVEDARRKLEGLGKDVEEARGTGLLGLDRAKKLGERLEGLKDLVDAVKTKIPDLAPIAGKVLDVAGKVAEVEGAVGGLKLLPWIVGAGTGGTGLLGVAALWLVRRGLKRVAEARSRESPPLVGTTTVINTPAPDPIKETIVRNESTLVPVEVESVDGEAMRWALDEFAKRYPGKLGDMETVKEFARQYKSGRRKP